MGLSAASGKIICPNFYLQVLNNLNFLSGTSCKVVYKSFMSLWKGFSGLGVFYWHKTSHEQWIITSSCRLYCQLLMYYSPPSPSNASTGDICWLPFCQYKLFLIAVYIAFVHLATQWLEISLPRDGEEFLMWIPLWNHG